MKNLDFENSMGVIVKSAAKSLERALDMELRKQCCLSGSQWKVIIALSVKDGLSQKEIADMVFVEGPTLVPVIDRMEKGGLVKRKPDPKDRRNNMIFLTKKSQTLLDPIAECVFNIRKKATKSISGKDLETTKTVLRKLVQNVDL